MKKLIFLTLTLCMTLASFAQDQTIFDSFGKNLTFGGFGGPIFKYTQLYGQGAVSAGGGGGLVINDFSLLEGRVVTQR